MDPIEYEPVVAALAAAARDLISTKRLSDLEQTLAQVVAAAVDTVPGADAGGVSMASRKRLESRAPSDDGVMRLDEIQAELEEGPCVSALSDAPLGSVVVVDDLFGEDAQRWPRFSARAKGVGYRSILSTQLSADGGGHAALNLYSYDASAFDTQARTLAALFGVQASLLLYGAERAIQLETALGTRDSIGQAKGILMERYAVDSEQAFQMLVRSSQDTNLKLVDIARWLTTDGRREADPPGS